ncbi:hypothetical protein [Gracilimonas sp.]|uniref:hypothetical protein n=1 Tax=Gracilimonas sp. TaxID=1974203 RepID=UPI0032EE4DE1
MEHTALTLLILQINKLLDTGKYDDITVDDIYMNIDEGTLLQFLKNECSDDIDLSYHLSTKKNFEKFYLEHLQSLYDAYAGDHKRKWGIKNKGLCLLLAWTNEILQQGSGWKPANNISKR